MVDKLNVNGISLISHEIIPLIIEVADNRVSGLLRGRESLILRLSCREHSQLSHEGRMFCVVCSLICLMSSCEVISRNSLLIIWELHMELFRSLDQGSSLL